MVSGPTASRSTGPLASGADAADAQPLQRRDRLIEASDALVEHMVVGQRQHELFARNADSRQCLGEEAFGHRMMRAEPRAHHRARPLDDGAFAIADHQIGGGKQRLDRRIAVRCTAVGDRRNIADEGQPHHPRRRRFDQHPGRDRRETA